MSRWRDLPSLSSLRAFDATARQGSFAEAGRLLNVTHAAVTQAVRGLETDLGLALVRRTGRTVSLTEAGERLARALDEGFGTVAAGIAALRQADTRRVLRVTTTTFIAETHVMPRLPEFWARHPGVEVALSPSPSRIDIQREGFDMAIRALSDGWAEAANEEVRPLVRNALLAVCAPSLIAGRTPDLQALPWIVGEDSPWDNQQFIATGIDPAQLSRVKVGSPYLEMSACRQGLGAMLATEIICRADLEAGRLIRLPLKGLPAVTYAVILPRGPRRQAVDQFADWLETIF